MAEDSSQHEYAHPEMLVETGWLREHLEDPGVRVIDCDEWPIYRRAHIPGSVGLRVHHYIKHPDFPKNPLVMPPDDFSKLMRRLGVSNDTLVVAYDGFGGLHGARVGWVLNYYGHENVKVLNGGWNKWLDEGGPADYKNPSHPAGDFEVASVDESMNCPIDYGIGRVGNPDTIFLDVRSNEEWDGSNNRGNKHAGHVPGAIHLEWLNFVTRDAHRTLKPAHELRALLEEHGITPDKEVIPY